MNGATQNFTILQKDSDFLTRRVLRFPKNIWEFIEGGSVLLVTLLAMAFDDKVPHKVEKYS